MRGSNLRKFLKALDLLSKPEGVTIDELQKELEIDRRSVYRQIEFIESLDFPIYDDKIPLEKKKRWKLEVGYLKKLPNMKIPDINLTVSEIIALYLLKGEGRLYKGTDIDKALNSAFAKIKLFVPDGLFDKLNKVKTLLIPLSKFAKDYSGKETIIDSLIDAIFQKKTCRIRYHRFYDDRIKEYRIDPLNFFENDGGLYIFVRKTNTNEIRTLAVERTKKLEITNSSFEYPEDFKPDELLNSSFDIIYDEPIEVKIWFSAGQSRYIKERKWAKEQSIAEQKDGSIILEMKTSGWFDVKKWIMSFGTDAKVLEPKELREDIIKELKAAANNYKKQKHLNV
ncbi:MAG: hypothetical protein A2889_08545 [Nitrospinae bacterium RIFCSPLOWO2_01_FULL_39_10]|nr:MAG: hypothetical protein A2889_08545 [Nitrospinae bacterium RIFCSPLOWO2_01_FULL_39_10]